MRSLIGSISTGTALVVTGAPEERLLEDLMDELPGEALERRIEGGDAAGELVDRHRLAIVPTLRWGGKHCVRRRAGSIHQR